MGQIDKFYLEKVFPEKESIFSTIYKNIDDINTSCIFVLDTNVLLVPYLKSKKSVDDFTRIFKMLKEKNRLFIPARVAREFIKNRGQKIADAYIKIMASKAKVNNAEITFDTFPFFETNPEYQQLKEIESQISKLKNEYKEKLDELSEKILNWKWDDPVSVMYKEIFTPDIIIEVNQSEEDLKKDHEFRNDHNIPPGFKKTDQKKVDGGIGDLIIWRTTLEIGKDKNSDIIFVTNEAHDDWFYSEQTIDVEQDLSEKKPKKSVAILPRYELYDEFRRFTNGRSLGIVNFSKFLSLHDASDTTVNEVTELIIIEAKYFTDKFGLDATSKLQSLVVNNTIDTVANNGLVGDPEWGVPKKLMIKYSVGNEINEITYNENDTVHLP